MTRVKFRGIFKVGRATFKMPKKTKGEMTRIMKRLIFSKKKLRKARRRGEVF